MFGVIAFLKGIFLIFVGGYIFIEVLLSLGYNKGFAKVLAFLFFIFSIITVFLGFVCMYYGAYHALEIDQAILNK